MSTQSKRLSSIPQHVVSVSDYEPIARDILDDNAWAYFAGGAGDEITLRANRDRLERLSLMPRVLGSLAGGHTRVELFGDVYEHPILIAPVAFQKLAHPDGEIATAQAAAALDAGLVISTQASTPIEDIAAIGGRYWFQLYFQSDREQTLALVRRAEAGGCKALVVTVDAPISGVRNREQRVGFRLPPGIGPVNLRGISPTPALTPDFRGSPVFDHFMARAPAWSDIAWLQGVCSMPVLLKGVLSPADAETAAGMGIAGIVVSNHGGRTLDTLPATIDALPRIADRVGDRVVLLMDGGIRRGTDVLKAIALGARAVLIGRPAVYGLTAAGALGVAHVLKLLRDELEIAMALTGVRTLQDASRDHILPSDSP